MANNVETNIAVLFKANYLNTEVGKFLINTGSTTIHVNPLCAASRVLLNKEILAKGNRNNESSQIGSATERVYYNPKFLKKPLEELSKKIDDKQQTNQNKAMKTSDSNIYLNRNYLVGINNHNRTLNQSRCGIHINPEFFKQRQVNKEETNKNSNCISALTPSSASNSNTTSTKKKGVSLITSNRNNIKMGLQAKSKYKIVKNCIASPPKLDNSTKGICFKTKYSIKRLNVTNRESNNNSSKLKATHNTNIKCGRLPSEFKKLSRTKLVRKSVLQALILARRHSKNNLFKYSIAAALSSYKRTLAYKRNTIKKKSTNITYFPKKDKTDAVDKNKRENINNSFKTLSKMKIVRKSILKARIEARKHVKKPHLLESRNLKNQRKSFISKYILRRNVPKQRALLKWRKKRSISESKNLLASVSSRIKYKKASNTPSSKHLKKNNQPCPLYNRFGRCKGKDRGTCSKLHDPKYISICRKLLQGECNTKDCLLSHDVRPGKMPTCHHYLAGLCTRSNCPFLHIKVNPKAPICMAFLQGFCPDVFNCIKRHEFICPIYAEKGSCPRGKSCTYPHRSQIVHSKLLKDDQKPLINHNQSPIRKDLYEVSADEIEMCLLDGDNSKDIGGKENLLKNMKSFKKPKRKDFIKDTTFTRYFEVSSNPDIETISNHDNIVDIKKE